MTPDTTPSLLDELSPEQIANIRAALPEIRRLLGYGRKRRAPDGSKATSAGAADGDP